MRSRTPFFASSEAHEPNMVQGEALLEGGACSSRLKAAPEAERSALCASQHSGLRIFPWRAGYRGR